jgi:hypothetical protein
MHLIATSISVGFVLAQNELFSQIRATFTSFIMPKNASFFFLNFACLLQQKYKE